MEHLTNSILNTFKEQIHWEKYWDESGCSNEDGRVKFICKAYHLCIQEVIP